MEGHKEVHVTLSPHSPVRDPPESSELIAALQVSGSWRGKAVEQALGGWHLFICFIILSHLCVYFKFQNQVKPIYSGLIYSIIHTR